ncbi:7TM-DISM domain-containing protein [Curvibacter sp. RS43]|uniref:sensor histidine kinase n=1 Tax=Curvibacter microcysteis TaxID=3026419 RepID=UPI002361C53C|nr:7TM-DISM domain-containing protein [Curvibacter sp. RS43]MDD0812687.1 7TM-DISM domain-containing protein [Curvibacter sp. RS43]
MPLLCLLALAWPVAGRAELATQIEVERAFWADLSGEARLEEVLGQAFQPAPTIVARGYQRGATWLRVTVPPTAAEPLWATLQPLYLDDLQLYSRQRGPDGRLGPWTMRQEGDRFPFDRRERATLNYSLALDTSATEPTVFYVRLRSTSTHALYVNVRTQSSALQFEGLTLLWLGLYLGIVLVLAWMSTLRFFITRDHLWAMNLVLQVGTVILTLFYLGVVAKYFMPHAPQGVDAWMSTVLCGHLCLGMAYYALFVKRFGAPRWAVWLYACTILAFPLQLWWIWHEQARLAMNLNSNLLLWGTLLGTIVTWFLRIQDTRLRWIVRWLFTAQTLYLIAFVLPLLGMGQMTFWHLYPALLINLFGSVMQHVVLTRRDQLDKEARGALEREVAASQLLLRAKHDQLTTSASFLGMLLHELKNPLASIRLAVLNMLRHGNDLSPAQLTRLEHIQAAVQGMDTVLDRCRQVDRLETGAWDTNRSESDLVELVGQCVSGHPEGQRVALSVPLSCPARVDVHSFQIVLGNLLDNALGYSPTDSQIQLRLQALTPAGRSGRWVGVRVGNSVGKAGLPDADRVFSKYYRAEGAHQRTGSGLGLYLVKCLVEREGGHINHHTEARLGAPALIYFEFYLPCH